MSSMQASWSWLRRNFAWSNSRQSWEERLGTFVLVAGGLATWWFSNKLDAIQLLVVVLLLAAGAAVLLRRGWLKLFGPVLFYDMVRTARRGRFVWIRFAYALLLLLLLWSFFMADRPYRGRFSDRNEAARLAQSYFETFMLVQFIMVALLTPGYVAGAIAEEKDRKTLEFLLATDLRNREIVLSKLLSRMANLTLFLLTGLPILSCLQFLGGVDPNLVLAGFAATAFTLAGLAGLSILNSTFAKRPRDAIACTYLFAIGYVLISFLAFTIEHMYPAFAGTPFWPGVWAPTYAELSTIFSSGNLLLQVGRYFEASMRGTLATVIPDLLWRYGLFMGAVFLSCTFVSILRLRAVALRQAHGKVSKSWSWRVFGRPNVGREPMLWKEIFVEGGVKANWIAMILIALLILATFAPIGMILFDYFERPQNYAHEWNSLATVSNIWVRTVATILSTLMLLAVAVRASTCISGERDKDTMDALLTSPLDSRSILLSKWLGSIASVRLAFLWLGAIWALGVITGGLHPAAVPLLLGTWLAYAGFVASLGLYFSLRCRTSLQSIVLTLLSLVVLGAGHWVIWICCMPLLFLGGGPGGGETFAHIGMFQSGLTPPIATGFLAFSVPEVKREMMRERFWLEMMGFCLFGGVFWAVGAAGMFGSVLGRFRSVANRRHESSGYVPTYNLPPPSPPVLRPSADRDSPHIQNRDRHPEGWAITPDVPPTPPNPGKP